jgi:hypothetical protein
MLRARELKELIEECGDDFCILVEDDFRSEITCVDAVGIDIVHRTICLTINKAEEEETDQRSDDVNS